MRREQSLLAEPPTSLTDALLTFDAYLDLVELTLLDRHSEAAVDIFARMCRRRLRERQSSLALAA